MCSKILIFGLAILMCLLSASQGQSTLEYYLSHTMKTPRRDSSCRPEDGFFLCNNSHCVERYDVRDMAKDCEDSSDQITELNCSDDEFKCRATGRCIPRRLSVDGCAHKRSTILGCRNETEFTCRKTLRCIPRHMVMDGQRDCDSLLYSDPSDEAEGLPVCLPSEYRCKTTKNSTTPGRCIPRSWVLDNITDCKETNSDEVASPDKCYSETEFRCKTNGRCVPRYRVMDKFADCSDSSDEFERLSCNEKEYRCPGSGRCIPRAWKTNGIRDCEDGSDETLVVGRSHVQCSAQEFRCMRSGRCIPLAFLCDGLDNCGDCSDEIESCQIFGAKMLRCPSQPDRCVPRQYSCDAVSDCPNRTEDIHTMLGFKCKHLVLSETSKYKHCSVPQWALYDQLPWCEDESDICFPNGEFVCARCLDNRTIIAKAQVCDGIVDCPDFSDECLCSEDFQTEGLKSFCTQVNYGPPGRGNCSTGDLYCDSSCVRRSQVCDGLVDCVPSALDEKFCGLDQHESDDHIKAKDFDCDSIAPFYTKVINFFGIKEALKATSHTKATKCDGKTECLFFEDECSPRANCTSRPIVCDTIPFKKIHLPTYLHKHLNPKGNETARGCTGYLEYILGSSVCNGIQECSHMEDETGCDRFYCDAGFIRWATGKRAKVSVSLSEVCDGKSDCINNQDEMNCSTKTHFYCTNQIPLFVNRSKVLDGEIDCTDHSDECPEDFDKAHAVSSKTDIIKSPILRGFVWIMAFLAVTGNIGVITITVRFLMRSNRAQASPMTIVNNVLVLNLAVADLIMGFCLVVIGGKSVQFSGRYCLEDPMWRASASCSALGACVMVSSEVSVFTLLLLTSYRLIGVVWPFKSRKLQCRVALAWVGLTWILALAIALLPMASAFSSYMVSDMLIGVSPYFNKGMTKLADLYRFALRLNALRNTNKPLTIPSDWYGLVDFLAKEFPLQAPKVLGFHGIYSANGVCIPKIYRLPGEETKFNAYSAAVVTFNFISLLFIIGSYVIIYKKSTEKCAIRRNPASGNRVMQRKITFLIVTDLCCWLPICVMTFLSMDGLSMSSLAYTISAVILLPINSALNPVIYSNSVMLTYNFAKRQFENIKCMTTNPKTKPKT